MAAESSNRNALTSRVLQHCDLFIERLRKLVADSGVWVEERSPLRKLLSAATELQQRLDELRNDHVARTLGDRSAQRTQAVITMAFQTAMQSVNETETPVKAQRSLDKDQPFVFPGSVFGVAEVLQFLSANRKTGMVTMRLKDEVVKITLADGELKGASSSRTPRALLLGEILIRQGSIERRTLERSIVLHGGKKAKLGKILLEQKLVTHQALMQALHTQITALFSRCLLAGGQDVEFTPGGEIDAADDISITIVEMLLEGMVKNDTDILNRLK